jgi:hypothetical protein
VYGYSPGETLDLTRSALLISIWARATTIRNQSARWDDITAVIPRITGFLRGCVATNKIAHAGDVII